MPRIRPILPTPFVAVLVSVGVLVACLPPARAQGLGPADYADEGRLSAWLWEHAPDVVQARGVARLAGAEVTRAHLRQNPTVDLTWGTIPLGELNPPEHTSPLTRVPNYTIGVTQPFEIGKRTHRQAAARATQAATVAQAEDVLRARFFDLLEAVCRIAEKQVRLATYDEIVQSSSALLALQRIRASKGDIATIDLSRAEVEHLRLLAQRDLAALDIEQAMADCTMVAVAPCSPFASVDQARGYLRRIVSMPIPSVWSAALEQRRPDIRALSRASDAALRQAELAGALALPDVSVRAGYTYDTFTVSGNQRQSVALGMQVSIPSFNRGEADRLAAATQLHQAEQLRRTLVKAGSLSLRSAARRRELAQARIRDLDAALPRALAVLGALTEAMRRGAASLADVLLARRSYQELLLERADLDSLSRQSVLDVRRAAALFPSPNDDQRVSP